MVFNLKVQAAKEPALHPAAAGKVHSGFDLMYRPGIFYGAGFCSREREFGLFNAVGELEHNTDHHPGYDHRHAIEQKHNPETVEQQRYREGHDRGTTP